MYEVLAVCIAALSVLSAVLAIAALWLKCQVKLDRLHDQLTKLIRANNIDRAIRLCGSASLPALEGSKALLVRVHRPHSLNLVYHEELAKLRSLEERWNARAVLRAFLQLGGTVALLALLSAGARESAVVHWSIGITVVALLIANTANDRIRAYLRAVQVYLLRLRNTLYAAAEYVPPEDRPLRKMTAEELAVWRASMEALEREVADQKGQGEDVKAADVHDARVQPDGVLPPL